MHSDHSDHSDYSDLDLLDHPAVGSPAYYRWRMRLYRLMLVGDAVLSAGVR